MAANVLILGCGRSGTSIFGELFEHLPDFTYLSEPPFSDLLEAGVPRPVAVKVPRESPDHPATPGLSFPLETMLRALAEPRRIYWQVRHPLDAIASLRIGIARDWGHHPRPPDWRAWLGRPLVEQCAHHWAYLNTVGHAAVHDLVSVCRFEAMVRDPHAFARGICTDVGLEVERCDAALRGWSERVQDTDNERFVEARTSRPYSRRDHERRIGRWRENLSHDEVRRAVPIVREAAARFGYALPDAAP